MASGAEHLAPGLHEYLISHSTAPDALLRDLIAETAARFPDRARLQVGPEQGTFMTMLAGLMGDRHAIEVGTYAAYWEEIVPRTRPGGVIVVDNTLLHGRIFHAEPDPDAVAIRQFNEHVLADDRVVHAMLPVGDGLTVARRK
jgi:caffeoyl-CoA O-methyltransferase